jgi:hypothetical protein
MGLTLDNFMAWKAEEMTMNTSSPCVAKSTDLVADFKKGIKRDPSLFPSLKHIDNWPTFKCETMAQAFAQDVVNVFNPKYKPRECYHLCSLIVVPTVVSPGQTHGLLISPCALLIFKVSMTT